MDAPEIPWSRVRPAVEAFVGSCPGDPADLGGSPRTHVWRVAAGGASYVVKVLRGDDDGFFAREAAALEVLDGTGVTPRLVGIDAAQRLMVLEDLGPRSNLADLLVGDDAAAAAAGLERWADAVARLHSTSADLVEVFETRRAELDPTERPEGLQQAVDSSVEAYRAELPALGIEPGTALEELYDLGQSVSAVRVLSPTDACPDNNLDVDGRLVLIDFEGAAVLNPSWDVAYLRVPWASCWCAWALPEEVAEAAVAHYVAVAGPGPSFAEDLAIATLAWSLVTPGWFLARALRPDPEDGTDPRMPTRRAMVQHRLRAASTMPGPAALTSFAADTLAVLEREWGVVRLPLAPAFR